MTCKEALAMLYMARAKGLTRPATSRREGVSSQIFMKNASGLSRQLQSKVLFSRCLMFNSVIRLVLVLRQIRKFYTSNSFLHPVHCNDTFIHVIENSPISSYKRAFFLFPSHIKPFPLSWHSRRCGRLAGTREKKPRVKSSPLLENCRRSVLPGPTD